MGDGLGSLSLSAGPAVTVTVAARGWLSVGGVTMVTMITSELADVFRLQGPVTDPGPHAAALADLTGGIDEAVRVVQGLLVHVFWVGRYGLTLTPERQAEVNLRTARRILDRALELEPSPIAVPRPPERRVVGNCRDHTVLLTAVLRDRGVPARARCGFATYFQPDHYEDHWVCEWWDASRDRWVLTDAQLDGLQREALGLDFDPLDTPRDQFVVAGEAWRLCRTGAADPDSFGIHDLKGLPFVLGDLVRDVLALTGEEILPWDGRAIMVPLDGEVPQADLPLLDRLAELSVACGSADAAAGEAAWHDLRALVAAEPRLHS